MLTGLAHWPAAHAGLLMAFLQEAVLAVGWVVVAGLLREMRAPALHWAGFALFSGVSFLAYVVGANLRSDEARLLGNLLLVAGMLLECRGLYLFIDRRPPDALLAGLLALTAVVLIGWSSTRDAAWRIAAVSSIIAGISIWISATVVGYVRARTARPRLAILFGLPLGLGSVVLIHRALNALSNPAIAVAETAAGSSIHISSVIFWLLLSLSLELTLVGLVIFELVSRLRHAARHDPLTGLLNRRALEEALEQETRRAGRMGRPFAVAMLDIDHFKAINDRHGHAAGDHVLKEIARVLRARLRSTDAIARWGGEEFLALLPETSPVDALAVGEAMRRAVRDATIAWEGDAVTVTVSVGIAGWDALRDDAGSLVDRADEALYRAKRAGRDRTFAAAEPLAA